MLTADARVKAVYIPQISAVTTYLTNQFTVKLLIFYFELIKIPRDKNNNFFNTTALLLKSLKKYSYHYTSRITVIPHFLYQLLVFQFFAGTLSGNYFPPPYNLLRRRDSNFNLPKKQRRKRSQGFGNLSDASCLHSPQTSNNEKRKVLPLLRICFPAKNTPLFFRVAPNSTPPKRSRNETNDIFDFRPSEIHLRAPCQLSPLCATTTTTNVTISQNKSSSQRTNTLPTNLSKLTQYLIVVSGVL